MPHPCAGGDDRGVKGYPDMPLSYAAGYALASDFPGSTMRELFSFADKNMYINKNHVKREEAAAEKRLDFHLLKLLSRYGRNFSGLSLLRRAHGYLPGTPCQCCSFWRPTEAIPVRRSR